MQPTTPSKQQCLYKGKAKSVYQTDDPEYLILHFRDDTSAFNGERVEQLARKGQVNNRFSAFVMQKLAQAGIATHFERQLSDDEVLVKRLHMLPIECVVRNYAAGSIVRRLGLQEGQLFDPPTYELFYKSDALGDPLISPEVAVSLGWATPEQLNHMQRLSLQINTILTQWFDTAGMLLVDFKLEFGVFNDRLVLGDEFSPDGCRIWDKTSKKKLDKDRFRQSLGEVIESYEEVGRRLGIPL